jgi:glycosyltransferase involved in cell wall biosynthesis
VRARHGIFVETRLRHLVAAGDVQAQVVAPVPWFPFTNDRFGDYASYARVPREETRYGIRIRHPRYPLLPAVGMTIAPILMAKAAYPLLRRLRGEYDLIDAHYFYPDGVAAALLGKWLDVPVVITARGTDINLIPRHRLPRRMILWAARRAAHMITVCQALKDELVALGADAGKVTALRNGVDLTRFQPVDRKTARQSLGLSRTTLLSVGHLIERKGHHLVIEAMTRLPECDLLIAGDGEMESSLRAQAARLGVAERVRFLGAIPQEELRSVYGAADLLVLASSREGWANVLLESMACGTPVVATRIWGTPEVVQAPEAGVLIPERIAAAIAGGVRDLMAHYPDRNATRRYAEGFDWEPTTRGQKEIFTRILATGARQ